jgi:hypothetical protein
VGTGDLEDLDVNALREAAACVVHTSSKRGRAAFPVPDFPAFRSSWAHDHAEQPV